MPLLAFTAKHLNTTSMSTNLKQSLISGIAGTAVITAIMFIAP